jgi:hypothetical protein
MTPEEWRTRYLESGPATGEGQDRLDLMRRLLADPATWSDPPSGIVESVAAEIGAAHQTSQPAPRRRRLVTVMVAAAVLLVAAFGVAGLIDGPADSTAIGSSLVGTELAAAARGTASLEETPSGWWIRLELDGLAPAPQGSFYQGWVWSQDEGISIGTFHLRGGSDPVILWSGVDIADYPSIWITLQAEGSGPAASELVMMRGEVTGITP